MVEVAVIGLFGVIFTAMSTVFGIMLKSFNDRINELEQRTERTTDYNRKLWNWARQHLDLYYQYRTQGSPEPQPIPHE